MYTPIMDILTHSDPRGKGQWYMYMDIILYHNTHEDLKFNTSQTRYETYSCRNIWQAGIQTYILPIEHSKTIKVHSSYK